MEKLIVKIDRPMQLEIILDERKFESERTSIKRSPDWNMDIVIYPSSGTVDYRRFHTMDFQ
jgi:hypothetical protein